jgi:hypothetical protein
MRARVFSLLFILILSNSMPAVSVYYNNNNNNNNRDGLLDIIFGTEK